MDATNDDTRCVYTTFSYPGQLELLVKLESPVNAATSDFADLISSTCIHGSTRQQHLQAY